MVNTYLYRIETVISLCRTSASQTSSTICGLALALMVIVMMTNPNQTFAWMKMAMIMMIMTIQNLPVGRPYVLSSPDDDNFEPIYGLALSAFPGAWLTTGLPLLSKCRYSHCFGRCQEPF